MIEVIPNLFVGHQHDYDKISNNRDWYVVHAAKEPFHRQALGYTTPGAPKDHPEYLVAQRGHRLILNLVDADTPNYIPTPVILRAIEFVEKALLAKRKVLIHCNQGNSRGPAIALACLRTQGIDGYTGALEQAEDVFRKVYPSYAPKGGMRGWLKEHWKQL